MEAAHKKRKKKHKKNVTIGCTTYLPLLNITLLRLQTLKRSPCVCIGALTANRDCQPQVKLAVEKGGGRRFLTLRSSNALDGLRHQGPTDPGSRRCCLEMAS